MTQKEIKDLLIDNISFQLRHKNYDRTIEVRKKSHSLSTGTNQEDEVTRYRRWEEDALKDQRIRLYNSPTKYALARPRKYWKRMPRIEGIRREFTVSKSDEDRLRELNADFYNFMPGESLEQWQNRTLEYLGVTDPNAWIVYDRHDVRNIEGIVIKTKVYPVIVGCEDALNFQRSFGTLQWLLTRSTELEMNVTETGREDLILESFYLYAPGMIAQAREVGRKTLKEKDDVEVIIPIHAATYLPTNPLEPTNAVIKHIGQPTTKKFYIRVKTNGTTEVPADCVGVYLDEQTGQNSYVAWFEPAIDVFNDLIRLKSTHDVLLAVHAYPKTWEFTSPCRDRHPDFGMCEGGYYNGIEDTEHRCHSCKGTGKPANFTTEQATVQLILPEENQDKVLELAKLAHTQPIETAFLEWLDGRIENAEAKIMAAVFDSGIWQRPNNSATKTATETNHVMAGISDVLAPFGATESRHFELAYRVAFQYQGFAKDAQVDKSYPDDLQIELLSDMVETFASIQEAGVGYEAIQAQRAKVYQKMFEGNPDKQEAVKARHKFKPFDDKTDEQEAMIIAGLAVTDPMRVLWTYWREIFQEIEVSTPKFYAMKDDAQRKLVDDKVIEFTAKIKEPELERMPIVPALATEDEDADAGQPD
jgi:hypothetical protein